MLHFMGVQYSCKFNVCIYIFVYLKLWRHGDRTPVTTFPTDTGNLEPTWPEGYGELTSVR